jgi:hypothetical protein
MMKRFSLFVSLLMVTMVTVARQHVPVILVAGQSNADGRVPMADFPKDIEYRFCLWSYGSGDFETATGQFTPYRPRVAKPKIERSWGFDAVVYHKLEQLWQRPFYVIKHTDGGTAIDPSCKSSTHGLYWSADKAFLDSTTSASHGGKSLLKAFCQQIDDCLPNLPENYDFKCLIWHQGESDQQAAGRYYENMKAVVAYARKHLVEVTGQEKYQTLPVVCGTFAQNSKQGSPIVADALRRLAREDQHFYVVEAGDLTLLRDQLHFDAQGAQTLGQRVFDVMVENKMVSSDRIATHGGVYNVRDYGAKGDGKALDSPAINAAIEAAVSNGGGQVLLPAGTYLSGSIRLKSNIDLHLAAGAKILAAPASMKAYDKSESFGGFPEYQDGGHTYFHNSLIWAEGQTNVSITGHGMIDGEGLTKKDTEKAGIVQGGSIGTGDKAIALKLCRQVTIRDITIYRGGHFAIIMTGCDLSTIDNVTIDTNRDGFDIDCCKYMTITNCKINTPSDDALVLKSSYALKKPVMTEHIAVSNCNITGYKCGTLLDGTYVPEPVGWVCGRFKLGTESNGGYRNISLTNSTFAYSSGLAFEEVDQGKMENIVVSNITMSHVHHYPIYITTGCRNRGPKEVEQPSTARDIQISNLIADDCDSLCSIIVTGMPGVPIENVWLSNIRLYFKGGGTKDLVKKEYREQGTNYPEPKFAGWTPAYGLYARHVKGLHVSDLTFRYERPDYRPAVVLDDVKDVTVRNLDAPTEKGIKQVVKLQ